MQAVLPRERCGAGFKSHQLPGVQESGTGLGGGLRPSGIPTPPHQGCFIYGLCTHQEDARVVLWSWWTFPLASRAFPISELPKVTP